MEITLTSENQRFVQEQLSSGAIPSIDALINEALTRYRTEETDWPRHELLAALQVGAEQLAHGEGIAVDEQYAERIKRLGREKIDVQIGSGS